jgi:hypothetical protein
MILAEKIKLCRFMASMAIKNQKLISPYYTCYGMLLKDFFQP